jgi:hypothetical protein
VNTENRLHKFISFIEPRKGEIVSVLLLNFKHLPVETNVWFVVAKHYPVLASHKGRTDWRVVRHLLAQQLKFVCAHFVCLA